MNYSSVAEQQKLSVRLDVKDFCIAFALVVFTILFVKVHLGPQPRPMEDASMLLRYSQNLARGHGIVWNVGEHPVTM